MEIPLYNNSSNSSNSFKLIQLTPDLLDVFNKRTELRLKSAGPDSPTFLCTETHTFQLRQISQSNTLLLLENDYDRLKATTLSGTYIECIPYSPSIDFTFIPFYDGADSAGSASHLRITRLDMESRVPVSHSELELAWKAAMGVEIDRHMYRLSQDFVARFVPLVITAIQAEGLNMQALLVNDVVNALDEDEPHEVVHAILNRFSTTADQHTTHLATWFGINLLSRLRTSKIDSFMFKWQESLPEVLSLTPELSYLTGQYVEIDNNTIKYLNSARLPIDPAGRFDVLFSVKGTWKLQDILPYLSHIEPDRAKVDTLFMKFAKKKVVKGVTYVTRR